MKQLEKILLCTAIGGITGVLIGFGRGYLGNPENISQALENTMLPISYGIGGTIAGFTISSIKGIIKSYKK